MRAILLLALAAATFAGEPPDRAWVVACLDALGSEHPQVRASAEDALARLGLDALPVILEEFARVEKDDARRALVRALAASGRDALIERLRSEPGEAAAALLALAEATAEPEIPESPPDVAKRVRELLDPHRNANRWSMNDPVHDELAALGRPAIGALVRELESAPPFGPIVQIVTSVLPRILEPRDEPLIVHLLRKGHLGVAKCLKVLPRDRALAVLLIPLEMGLLDYQLAEELGEFLGDERVRSALLAIVAGPGRTDHRIAQAAELLGEAKAYDAAPAIARRLSVSDRYLRLEVARAAARLGVKDGIPLLIALVDPAPTEHTSWPAIEAGRALNEVFGEEVFRGKIGHTITNGVRRDFPPPNYAEARARFEELWSERGESLEFDRETGRWK